MLKTSHLPTGRAAIGAEPSWVHESSVNHAIACAQTSVAV